MTLGAMEERARPADARTEPEEELCQDVKTSEPLTGALVWCLTCCLFVIIYLSAFVKLFVCLFTYDSSKPPSELVCHVAGDGT